MLIQHKQVGQKGIFFIGREGIILAELLYNISANRKMVIEHTEVDESLSGKNVGKQLVETAVEYARTKELKIIPLCPFAKSLFDRIVDWQDILA
jgi:uncharacterized protein